MKFDKMKTQTKHFLLAGLLFFSLLTFSRCTQKEVQTPPNVIYIFPDQYRNFSLGFWSQGDNKNYLQGNPDPVSTPALDVLANEGIVFNRAMSNYPLCSPYRGMLLTGMYPDNNGLTTNCRKDRDDIQLKTDAVCTTDVFAQAGYNVAYFGKCHWQKTEALFDENGTYVGTSEPPGGNYINNYDTYVPPGPDRHSIDYFFQTLKDDHFNPLVYSNDPAAIGGKKDGELYKPHRFSSEIESEVILDYLSNTRGQRNPDKPFFIIWSLNPPHNPWTEKTTYMEFFDQYTDSGKVDMTKLISRENVDLNGTAADHAPYYFANVSAVDYFIGKVLNRLDELNLTQNTIIVFTSDHGEMLGSHGVRGKPYPETEAYNIPFIIKWGDKLKHRIEDLILSVPDVMPTLLGLVGLKDKIPAEVQGRNFSQILLNKNDAKIEKPSSALFIRPKTRGVYTGKNMFVVEEESDGSMLVYGYDNEKDPYQMNKIRFEEIQNGPDLKRELARLLKDTNDSWCRDKKFAEFLSY